MMNGGRGGNGSSMPVGLAVSPSIARRRSTAVRKRQREVTAHRGNWSAEEDATLRRLVRERGAKGWREIAAAIPKRTGKQVRERWINQLSPGVKGGGWTEEEDRMVVFLQGRYGNKWSIIAKSLDGRTDNHVKNRYNSTLRRKREAGFYDSWLESIGWARRPEQDGERWDEYGGANGVPAYAAYESNTGFYSYGEARAPYPRVSSPLSFVTQPPIDEGVGDVPQSHHPISSPSPHLASTGFPGAATSSRKNVMSVHSLLS